MLKGKDDDENLPWWGELFRADLYKRSQGRYTRQATWFAIALVIGLGAWQLQQTLQLVTSPGVAWASFVAVLVVGLWISFRAVNYPSFADFLIQVEAEMNKVMWPTWGDVYRASVVVILVMFSLAMVLFLFDLVWQKLFQAIGVVP